MLARTVTAFLAVTALLVSGCLGGSPSDDYYEQSPSPSTSSLLPILPPPIPDPFANASREMIWDSESYIGNLSLELRFEVQRASSCDFQAAAKGRYLGSALKLWLSRIGPSSESFRVAAGHDYPAQAHAATVDARPQVRQALDTDDQSWSALVGDSMDVDKSVTYLVGAFDVDGRVALPSGTTDHAEGSAIRIKMSCGSLVRLAEAKGSAYGMGFNDAWGPKGGASATGGAGASAASARLGVSRDDKASLQIDADEARFRLLRYSDVADNGTITLSHPGGYRAWMYTQAADLVGAESYLRHDGVGGAYHVELDRVSVNAIIIGVLLGLDELESLEELLPGPDA